MKKLRGILSVCLALGMMTAMVTACGKKKEEKPGLVDFVVEVESGREARVLQLTDTQIIDAAQTRPGREGVDFVAWDTDKMDEKLFDCARYVIESYNPDLILITGDLVYGEFDDNGTSLQALIAFMDSFEIPWAPVFGNHDNESELGVDWQCEQLEKSKYCLFKQRELTGNGNYSVGIEQDGKLTRAFFMLDSNGCGAMSMATMDNGHSNVANGFGVDQIDWYTDAITKIHEESPETKISMAFHIQMAVWGDAMAQYGFSTVMFDNEHPINLDELGEDGAFGYIGRNLKGAWDYDYIVWNSMKELGVDSIFAGHEHSNSASVMYEGIRVAYGLKTGTYDRANFKTADGSIVASYSDVGEPLIGGTAINLGADGTISDTYHIYYEK